MIHFRFYFNSFTRILFTFPSQYSFAIGDWKIIRFCECIHNFQTSNELVQLITWVLYSYRIFTFIIEFSNSFPTLKTFTFTSAMFARHYLLLPSFISFPMATKMFHFTTLLTKEDYKRMSTFFHHFQSLGIHRSFFWINFIIYQSVLPILFYKTYLSSILSYTLTVIVRNALLIEI